MSDRKLREAEAPVKRAVATFINTIDRIRRRGGLDVPTKMIREILLLELCDKLITLIDDPGFVSSFLGPEEMKLSNVMVDCRDSRWEHRGRA